jgi:hypothetical protein
MKKVIVYQVDDKGIHNNLGEYKLLPNYLDFLLQNSKDTVKLFANLDDDVSKLLRLLKLSDTQLYDLATAKACMVDKFYKLMYIPGKWFSIDKGYGRTKEWTGFSDLVQYDSLGVIDSNDIKYYGVLAEEVYQSFVELGFNPNNLISPANVYRKEVLSQLDLPRFDDIPSEAMTVAYECCKGSWIESFAIGKFDKVYDYDINSAFPHQASNLLDLRLGTWKQSKEYQKEATYGYCRCEVNIESDFSPIIKCYDDRNYTPKGVFETSLTKAEIDFIEEWGLGFVTIVDGWWWLYNSSLSVNPDIIKREFPFKEAIDKLYKQKQESTGIKRDIVKRIMAGSFYGIFIEIRDTEFGEFFMAPYAAEIESRTRLSIAEFILKNHAEKHILSIAVDGVVLDIPLEIK